jgi:hypothetical protein
MVRRSFTVFAVGCALCLALAASAFAQYGGGMGGGTGGTGVYTPPKGGYKTSTGIAIGAAAAAGAGIAYVALHNRPAAVGCVQQSGEGSKLMNEKDKKTYALLASNNVVLSPGERVSLKGKKMKDDNGNLTFHATKVVKDYGPCRQ